MSRSGYSDDCDNIHLYRAAVDRAIQGKRGQAFLRELIAALDAMPVKELIDEDMIETYGQVCALGAVGVARGMQGLEKMNADTDPRYVAQRFGIAPALAAEIMFENDESDDWHDRRRSPARRWLYMRDWAARQLIEWEPQTGDANA